MKRLFTLLLVIACTLCVSAKTFVIEQPNKKLSPYTGVTRDHWKQAATYLLEGAFNYVHQLSDPMDLPKQEGKSYPRNEGEVPTARMEAMCRTMFLAGPLLKEDPELTINGIKVGEYYRYQIASFLDPKSPVYLPRHRGNGHGGQKLVELGGLSVSLLMAPEVFWTPLPKETRDQLADVFKTYAEGGTIDMNWRFFNMCLLSFLDGQGYEVKRSYLEELLHKNLNAYVGDGWYHDAPLFDYYSMWAFQMYGPLWAESYGKKAYPKEAEEFMTHLRDIPNQYPYMFGRDGHLQMWGRSITYRMGAAIPLALTGLLQDESIDYGWMRRICSGALMQFLQHPDFLAEDGLPNLGFYGHFEPCLQHYSCRGSVFWMAKLFLALYLPADNPFWTAKETEGAWEKMQKGTVNNVYASAPKTLTTNYPSTGMTEFRNVFTRNSGFYYGLESYNRLAYNSTLIWQADGKNGEVAQSYVVRKNGEDAWHPIESYQGDGLLPNGWFQRTATMENDKAVKLSLLDLPTPDGTLRNDEIELAEAREVRMGFYALPQYDKPITQKLITLATGQKAMVIDNGKYQLATILLEGWDDLEFVSCQDLHPETKQSAVVNLKAQLPAGKHKLRSMLVIRPSGKPLKLEAALQNEPIRVACIGNSITYGHGINDRRHDTYPAQLQALLGNKYQVENFGASGTTAQTQGDSPWKRTEQYTKAKEFQPQVAIIKLGTNDSKPQNWVGAERYIADLEALALEFESLESHPRIIIALPAKAYKEAWRIRDEVISGEMLAPIKKMAKRHKWTVVDLYKTTSNVPQLFPDGIHPNPEGAGLIAREISKKL